MSCEVRRSQCVLIVVILLAVGSFAIVIYRQLASPRTALLISEAGARWIGIDEPFSFAPRPPGIVSAKFRTTIQLKSATQDALLTIRAFKTVTVLVDGKELYRSARGLADWKTPDLINLAERLMPGKGHVLEIVVHNEDGPAALLAYCDALKISTGKDWEASCDGASWFAARELERPQPVVHSRKFLRADRALRNVAPVLAPIFLVVFAWNLQRPSGDRRSLLPSFSAGHVRWLLLVAWGVLGVNNFAKIPYWVGYDIEGHMAYVVHLVQQRSLPLATDGWQMFQPPLYYLIASLLFKLLSAMLTVSKAWLLLRFISILSGAMHVELCYRASRCVFPDRPDLQKIGTTLGAMLPMNLYISQVMGNEPLAGALSASVIVVSLIFVFAPERRQLRRLVPLLGVLLGLAMLTKSTAVLLAPPLFFAVMSKYLRDGQSWTHGAAVPGGMLAITAMVGGWYYMRNWIELGTPLVGGLARPDENVWQDPGYRTLSQFLTFGESLTYPIYSGVRGFWDSFYSTFWLDGWLSSMSEAGMQPPWNFSFLISGAWLSVLPTLGILAGIFLALRRPARWEHPGLLLAVACIVVYLVALLDRFLMIPNYSAVKATYTTGLIPCYAVLGAKGLDMLLRGRVLRAVVHAMLVCWAFSAYAAYFVV